VVDASGPVVRIIDITVRRSRRGRGIATSVITALSDEAQQAGQGIEIVIWGGNTAARHTFETLGFEVTSNEGGYLSMHRSPSRIAA